MLVMCFVLLGIAMVIEPGSPAAGMLAIVAGIMALIVVWTEEDF